VARKAAGLPPVVTPQKDEFSPLSDDALAVVAKAWGAGSGADIIATRFNYELTVCVCLCGGGIFSSYLSGIRWAREEVAHVACFTPTLFCAQRQTLQTLKGLTWLNDNIINAYLAMVVRRAEADASLPKLWCACRNLKHTTPVSHSIAAGPGPRFFTPSCATPATKQCSGGPDRVPTRSFREILSSCPCMWGRHTGVAASLISATNASSWDGSFFRGESFICYVCLLINSLSVVLCPLTSQAIRLFGGV
jgi:hypothetical protein